MNDLQAFYNAHQPKGFYLTHYELAALPGSPSKNPEDWKTFLLDPRVAEYVSQELNILQQAEMRKLLDGISGKSRSIGTAQTLTALQKSMEGKSRKDGPAFIYTFVPLNPEEAHSPNIVMLDHDPFRKEL